MSQANGEDGAATPSLSLDMQHRSTNSTGNILFIYFFFFNCKLSCSQAGTPPVLTEMLCKRKQRSRYCQLGTVWPGTGAEPFFPERLRSPGSDRVGQLSSAGSATSKRDVASVRPPGPPAWQNQCTGLAKIRLINLQSLRISNK